MGDFYHVLGVVQGFISPVTESLVTLPMSSGWKISKEWTEQLLPSRKESQWPDTWQLQICIQFNSWKAEYKKTEGCSPPGSSIPRFVNYCGLIKKQFLMLLIIQYIFKSDFFLFSLVTNSRGSFFNIHEFYWMSYI